MNIAEIFTNAGMGKTLTTLLISMLPIVELRGAIPVGAGLGLPVWQAACLSIVGNMIPVPFIIAFVRKVLDWLRNRSERAQHFVAWLESKGTGKKADQIRKAKFWGLLLFVAVPLPGTGAWTGALIAALLNMRMRSALPPIFLGVLVAGLLVSLATSGVIHLVF